MLILSEWIFDFNLKHVLTRTLNFDEVSYLIKKAMHQNGAPPL